MMISQQTTHKFIGERVMGSVKANGGSMLVEVEHGEGSGVWIQADNFTADYAGMLDFGYASVRFTPTGGATLNIYEA